MRIGHAVRKEFRECLNGLLDRDWEAEVEVSLTTTSSTVEISPGNRSRSTSTSSDHDTHTVVSRSVSPSAPTLNADQLCTKQTQLKQASLDQQLISTRPKEAQTQSMAFRSKPHRIGHIGSCPPASVRSSSQPHSIDIYCAPRLSRHVRSPVPSSRPPADYHGSAAVLLHDERHNEKSYAHDRRHLPHTDG